MDGASGFVGTEIDFSASGVKVMPLRPKTCRAPGNVEGRPSARKRGYDSAWERRAKAHLDAHPCCVRCEKQGIVTEATEVDHAIPHRGNRALFDDDGKFLNGGFASPHD